MINKLWEAVGGRKMLLAYIATVALFTGRATFQEWIAAVGLFVIGNAAEHWSKSKNHTQNKPQIQQRTGYQPLNPLLTDPPQSGSGVP